MPEGVGARFFDICDSTNTVATDAARAGLDGPCWFVAGAQTAGRGRRGRVWVAEPGNLYASLLVRPGVKPGDLAALPYIVALAVRDTFVALGAKADRVCCKWPNDILIGGRKSSGILIESSASNQDKVDFVVIGIGMNLAHYPGDAIFPATSLAAETHGVVAVRDAMTVLAAKLDARLKAWQPNDFAEIAREWTSVAWKLGQAVEIRSTGDHFKATPIRLENDGGLLVRLDDGSEKRLYAGDVFPVTTG